MKILVCVKLVPDMESAFRVDACGNGWETEGLVFRMNRYDECACEEAVRIKESRSDVEIDAVTVGPSRAEAVARKALEYGIDRAAHIEIPDNVRPDALSVAKLIADYARDRSYDLVLFGIMSEDEGRFAVGPATAALLGIPCATAAVKIDIDGRVVRLTRELEGGAHERVETSTPCAITVQTGINIPRYPNLTNKLRAKKQAIEKIVVSNIESARSRIVAPPPGKGGIFIEGTPEEKAEKLARIFYEKAGVTW